MSNNPLEVVVGMTRQQAEFLIRNCDSNIILSLGLIMKTDDRETGEKIVEMLEAFKALKDATKKALKE